MSPSERQVGRRTRKDRVQIGPDFGPRVAALRKSLRMTQRDFLGPGREGNLSQIELGRRKEITIGLAQELEEKFEKAAQSDPKKSV